MFIALGCLIACSNDATVKSETSDSTDRKNETALNYHTPISYSSDFKIGDSKHAQTVLDLWKAWDAGDLNSTKQFFSDSVSMYFSSGDSMKAVRDSVVAGAQYVRDQFSSMKSTIHAITSLRSDKNEDWVAVWGTEVGTGKDGKSSSLEMHEIWKFDDKGRVTTMYQYGRPSPPTQK